MNDWARSSRAPARRVWFLAVGLGLVLPALAAPPPPASNPFSGMDPAVRPGNDFFDYANGGWIKNTEIPADRPSFGTDEALSELTNKRTAELIQGIAAASPAAGSSERQIADYYRSVMDEKGIEAKGMAPVQSQLSAIEAIKDRSALSHYLGTTLRADVDILNSTSVHTDHLLGLWVAQDLDDPAHYAPFLLQGGLGMPDREYYVSDKPHMRELQEKYRHYISSLLQQAGAAPTEADKQAARVFELEHQMAQVHVSRGESEDVQRGHNHWARADFATRAPGLDWDAFFAGAELSKAGTFVVWQPKAVTGLSALVARVPLTTWKEYLRFHAVDHFGGLLPKAVADARFAFYGQALTGTPQQPERWKTAVRRTNVALGEAVGRLYVQKYFSAQAKHQVEDLVQQLIAAFATHIDGLDWMAPQTKVEAKAKLKSLKVGVGYPDHWRDYAGLQVVAGEAYANAERSEAFDYQWNLAKLGKPQIDRGEWVMTPQEVNAVNLPAVNALNFPAAILQPPYFDPNAPAALNYGATGGVIGHEISHSFDDQGAQFDASGKLRNWWTPQDYAHFKAASAQLVKQFNGYKPFPDLAVNGAQTLSENIADLAGLAIAYSAYRHSLGDRPAAALQGFDGDQQFFLSFAISWRGKERDALLRDEVVSDGHAPRRYRAYTVRNLDAWYAAFGVKPDATLYLSPAERVRMW